MIAKVLSRLLILFFVLLSSQLPVFVDQYVLRLEGHLAESNRQIVSFQEAASMSSKTLNAYISKFLEQPDVDFKNQGKIMQDAVERNLFLSSARDALYSANPLIRPIVFVRYVDSHIVADAWKSFAVGISFTLDVGVWALIGLIMGWIFLMALSGLWHSFTQTSKEPSSQEKR